MPDSKLPTLACFEFGVSPQLAGQLLDDSSLADFRSRSVRACPDHRLAPWNRKFGISVNLEELNAQVLQVETCCMQDAIACRRVIELLPNLGRRYEGAALSIAARKLGYDYELTRNVQRWERAYAEVTMTGSVRGTKQYDSLLESVSERQTELFEGHEQFGVHEAMLQAVRAFLDEAPRTAAEVVAQLEFQQFLKPSDPTNAFRVNFILHTVPTLRATRERRNDAVLWTRSPV